MGSEKRRAQEAATTATGSGVDLQALADQYVKEWDARAQRSARLALEVGWSATSQVEEMFTADDPGCRSCIGRDRLAINEAWTAADNKRPRRGARARSTRRGRSYTYRSRLRSTYYGRCPRSTSRHRHDDRRSR